jgi:hypothetical protein
MDEAAARGGMPGKAENTGGFIEGFGGRSRAGGCAGYDSAARWGRALPVRGASRAGGGSFSRRKRAVSAPSRRQPA